MKTTFKKVFDEFDDELMNIDVFSDSESIDIDVEKIKGEVLMRIDDKNGKKKFSKKFITIMVAAAIVVTGTVGAFASGSVQSVFQEFFNNSINSGMNSAGLYDGGNVELISCDDSLNVELLGVTGDGEQLYSAIEVTKKDGSPVINSEINENYKNPFRWLNDHPMPLPEGKTMDDYFACRTVYVDKNGNFANYKGTDSEVETNDNTEGKNSEVLVIDDIGYSLSEGNKSLKICVYSRIVKGDLQDGRVTVTSEGFGAYGTRYFELPFEISFDLNYETDGNISEKLTIDDAPNLIEPAADKVTMEVTPFAVYLYGQCDKKIVEESGWSEEEEACYEHCFNKYIDIETSKIILNDGTVFYLFPWAGYDGVGEDGNADYYEEKMMLKFLTVPTNPEEKMNVIDTREIQTIIICGDTVYSR